MKKSFDDEKVFRFNRVAECLYRDSVTGIFYALVKRGGRQFKKSLRTNDRKLAERLLKDYRQQVGGLNARMAAGKVSFAELSQRWFEGTKVRLKPSSAARLELSIKQLRPFFGLLPVRNITTATCMQWETQRGSGLSSSTFNQERGALRRILEFAIHEGLLFENPAARIRYRKLGKAKIVVPSHAQFQKLLHTIRTAGRRASDAAELVELLACSGIRLAEATALTWADVDFERGCFTVTGGEKGTKNREARTVPLFPAMRTLLERLKTLSQSNGSRVIPILSAKKAVATACRKAGLPHFHHHTFRHYFVSNAIEAGVDFKVIANWVGHKDGGILVARTYGHLRDSHSFEMAKRMTLCVGLPPTPGDTSTRSVQSNQGIVVESDGKAENATQLGNEVAALSV